VFFYTLIFCTFGAFATFEGFIKLDKNSSGEVIFAISLSFLTILTLYKLLRITWKQLKAMGLSKWHMPFMVFSVTFPYSFMRLTGLNIKKKVTHFYIYGSIFLTACPFVFETVKSKWDLKIEKAISEEQYFKGKTEGYRSMVREFRDAFPHLLTREHWEKMEKIEAEKNDRSI